MNSTTSIQDLSGRTIHQRKNTNCRYHASFVCANVLRTVAGLCAVAQCFVFVFFGLLMTDAVDSACYDVGLLVILVGVLRVVGASVDDSHVET